MRTFINNVIANFVGKVFIALLAILLVPVYIHYLGIEKYGLVGFYTTLINAMAILDFGFSTTLNREIAKAKATNTNDNDLRNLVFSMERIYWCIGIVICTIIIALSGLIATYWLNTQNIPHATMQNAIMLMGLIIAVQWPLGFYHGGFMGLERQVKYNIISMIMMALRSLGAVVVLKFISPTIEAFFIWQVIINLGYVLWLKLDMWQHLTKIKTVPAFSFSSLKHVWRFAAGMTGTGIVTFFLTQADKIVLSKILSLQDFAYYSLAFTVSSSLAIFIMPVTTAVFPKFSALIAKNDSEKLIDIYHISSRLIATIIIPVCITLIIFTPQILLVWIKDENIVRHSTDLTRLLVTGSLFNSLMMTPYLLTLAKGWTRFGLYQNLIAAIILFPTIIWLTNLYGSIGAAFVWMLVNICTVLISVPIIHKKVLKGQSLKWYLNDNLIPLVFSAIICVSCHFIYAKILNGYEFGYFGVATLFGVTVVFTFLQFPYIKSYINNFAKSVKFRHD